jgi:predicted esterase
MLMQSCTISKDGKIQPLKVPQAKKKPAPKPRGNTQQGQNKPGNQGAGQGNGGVKADVYKANGVRYKDKVFQSVVTKKEMIVGNIPTWDNKKANITVDFYFPEGDKETKRPCIIFYYGGAWASKMKTGFPQFNSELAMKGYVAVSGDYRVGFQGAQTVAICVGDPEKHMKEAMYRALQDVKALIRHLRANADAYGIDPNKIYVGGGSAGGANAINSLFMDEADVPEWISKNIGSLESVGGFQNYSSKPNGVFALAGLLFGTESMLDNTKVPVYLLQGQCDELIPFNEGQAFPHCKLNPNMPKVIGCNALFGMLKKRNVPVQFDIVCGGGHGSFEWGTLELNRRIAEFCYEVMTGTFKTQQKLFIPEVSKCPGKTFPECEGK